MEECGRGQMEEEVTFSGRKEEGKRGGNGKNQLWKRRKMVFLGNNEDVVGKEGKQGIFCASGERNAGGCRS